MGEKFLSTVITEKDLRNARALLGKERVKKLTNKEMFRTGIYCILSATERHDKTMSMYEKLLKERLDTQINILNNRYLVWRIVKKARFPYTKDERIHNFASWWPSTDLPEKIIADYKNGRKEEFGLRNELADNAPGIWYKGASLFMIKCGYENVVPIDIWMLTYLKNIGFDVKIPDYTTQGCPKPKEYLELEKILSEMSKERGVSPAIFQFAVWGKYSEYNNGKK